MSATLAAPPARRGRTTHESWTNSVPVIERSSGPALATHPEEAADDARVEIDAMAGPAPSALAALAATRRDMLQLRLAMAQRELPPALVDGMAALESRAGVALIRELRRHELWPWLSQYPGLGGIHVATLLALIGDPHRFPGQRCSLGHTTSPGHPVGAPCGALGPDDEPCPGTMLAPRTTTGVRSLWHYCGLHVVGGRLPRRARGQRADWNPAARTAVLQPGGIAEQIVRHRIEPYRGVYDATKARLAAERGLPHEQGPAEHRCVIEDDAGRPLRPIDVERIARTVAAKAFVGDLLAAWKALEP